MTGQRRPQYNQREKRALVRIFSVAALFILLFLLFAPNCGLRSYWLIQKQNKHLTQENLRLRRENSRLQEDIQRIQHDDHYLEQIAREKYNMLRKNEEVYYISPPPVEKKRNDGL